LGTYLEYRFDFDRQSGHRAYILPVLVTALTADCLWTCMRLKPLRPITNHAGQLILRSF